MYAIDESSSYHYLYNGYQIFNSALEKINFLKCHSITHFIKLVVPGGSSEDHHFYGAVSKQKVFNSDVRSSFHALHFDKPRFHIEINHRRYVLVKYLFSSILKLSIITLFLVRT